MILKTQAFNSFQSTTSDPESMTQMTMITMETRKVIWSVLIGIQSVICLIQLYFTWKFFAKARRVSQLCRITKFLIVCVNVSVVSNWLLWVQEYILIPYGTQYDNTKIPLYIFTYVPQVISVISILRFFSIQVQLRAAVENTKLIVSYMEKNKRILIVYLVNISLLLICFFVSFMVTTGLINNIANILRGLVQTIIIALFCYQLLQMITSLNLFFRELNDNSFPYKLVTAVVLVFAVSDIAAGIYNMILPFNPHQSELVDIIMSQ